MTRVKGRSAYTLVELMIVTVMTGLLVAAMGTVLLAGVRVWSRVTQVDRPESETVIAMLILERDLRNRISLHFAPFEGNEKAFSFATVNRVRTDELQEDRLELVTWRFDKKDSALIRSVQRVPSIAEEEPEDEILLFDLESAEFRYVGHQRVGSTGLSETVTSEAGVESIDIERLRLELDFGEGVLIERELDL